MKLYACRKVKKDGSGNYLAIEARAEWGRVLVSYDTARILELLPYGVDHKTLNHEGVCIGEIYETI